MVCTTSKGSNQPAHTRCLVSAFAGHLNILTVKLLTEQHLEFLSLKGGCTGSPESRLVKMPHCWKSHVRAHIALADPEKYVRRGPAIKLFYGLFLVTYFTEGRGSLTGFLMVPIPVSQNKPVELKVGQHHPASKTPYKWCFAVRPMMTQH